MMKPTIFCGVPRVYDRIYTGSTQTQIVIVLSSNFQPHFVFSHNLGSHKLKVLI